MMIGTADNTPTVSPQQIIRRILRSGKITATERNWFLRAMLTEICLTPEELEQVRHLLDRLQMGLIKVVD